LRGWRRHATGYAFVGPALLILAAFLLYPIGYSLWLSLHEWDGYTPRWGPFVGIENYRALAGDEVFWRAMVNSIVFVVVRTPLEVGLGFLLALLLNRKLAARSLLRTLFFVPVVMSLIVVTIIFQRVYEPNTGLLNTLLTAVGLSAWAHPWLGDPATALPAVIAVSVWKNVGFSLVILLAGLQGLPQDVLEAARVDGANAWQLTLRVITPLMRPILALTALLSIIGGLKVFDLVFIMTRGGPTYSTEVLATMLYREAFELNHMGVASAIGVILVAVVLSIARVQTFALRESRGGEMAAQAAAARQRRHGVGGAAGCAGGVAGPRPLHAEPVAHGQPPALRRPADPRAAASGELSPGVGGEQHRAALLEQHLHLDRVHGRDRRDLRARRLRPGADPLPRSRGGVRHRAGRADDPAADRAHPALHKSQDARAHQHALRADRAVHGVRAGLRHLRHDGILPGAAA
jgi:ABC-type sugar transport system permease subunit